MTKIVNQSPTSILSSKHFVFNICHQYLKLVINTLKFQLQLIAWNLLQIPNQHAWIPIVQAKKNHWNYSCKQCWLLEIDCRLRISMLEYLCCKQKKIIEFTAASIADCMKLIVDSESACLHTYDARKNKHWYSSCKQYWFKRSKNNFEQ